MTGWQEAGRLAGGRKAGRRQAGLKEAQNGMRQTTSRR
jgi:hypothetical protein